MKIVCISDTHSKHEHIDMPEGDILIHSGDICFANKGDQQSELVHLNKFNDWLATLNYKHKIVIAGNHDMILEDSGKEKAKELLSNAIYLDQELVEVEGFRIYGEPRQPEFFDWGFNVSRKRMKDVWELVPENVDILVTHGPPHGHGDIARDMHGGGWGPPRMIRAGCKYQRALIDSRLAEGAFKLVVCGHIHSGYGRHVVGPTQIVNASVVNERYHPVNKPIVIEL